MKKQQNISTGVRHISSLSSQRVKVYKIIRLKTIEKLNIFGIGSVSIEHPKTYQIIKTENYYSTTKQNKNLNRVSRRHIVPKNVHDVNMKCELKS